MSFQTHLESIVSQVDGALACSLMGFDGIAVESHRAKGAESVDLEAAMVEYTNVMSQLKNAAEEMKTGGVNEVSINTYKLLTVIRLVTPEYFLALALKPDGNFGKGRYVLRITAPKVRAEL